MEVLEQIALRLYPILVALMSTSGHIRPVAILLNERLFVSGNRPPGSDFL
jgi:hypothetical protein